MGERSDNILHSGSMVVPANDTSVHQYELFSSTPFNNDWGIALVHIDSTSNLDDVTLSFIRTSARELVGVSRASQETASGSELFVLNAANSYAADIVGTRWRILSTAANAIQLSYRDARTAHPEVTNAITGVLGRIDDIGAADISVDSSEFDGNLEITDDTVQKVAQRFDDYVAGQASHVSVDSTGFDGNLDTDDDTLQEVAQRFDDYNPAASAVTVDATNLGTHVPDTVTNVQEAIDALDDLDIPEDIYLEIEDTSIPLSHTHVLSFRDKSGSDYDFTDDGQIFFDLTEDSDGYHEVTISQLKVNPEPDFRNWLVEGSRILVISSFAGTENLYIVKDPHSVITNPDDDFEAKIFRCKKLRGDLETTPSTGATVHLRTDLSVDLDLSKTSTDRIPVKSNPVPADEVLLINSANRRISKIPFHPVSYTHLTLPTKA